MGREELNGVSQLTISYGASKDLILVHIVQLKPNDKSTFLRKNGHYSPAAEVGNPASLDKVFFFTLWDIYNNIQVGVEFYPWAIKNIQDGCRKTGEICDGDVHFW